MRQTEHVPAAWVDRNLNRLHPPNPDGLSGRDNRGSEDVNRCRGLGIDRTRRRSERVLVPAPYIMSRTSWLGEMHRRPTASLSHRLT